MNIRRPVFLVSEITDADAAVSAVIAITADDCLPLVLLQPADARLGRFQSILDTRNCTVETLRTVRAKGEQICQFLARRGTACQMEILRHNEPWRIRAIAKTYGGDLLVKSPHTKDGQNRHDAALQDADLATNTRLPICIIGASRPPEGPVVGLIDPMSNSAAGHRNNVAVVDAALNLAAKNKSNRAVLAALRPPAIDEQACRLGLRRLLEEGSQTGAERWHAVSDNHFLRKSVSLPRVHVEFHVCEGSKQKFSGRIAAIDPIAIVMGRPLRSALSRCFDPGMASIISGMGRTVLIVQPNANQESQSVSVRKKEAADFAESPAKPVRDKYLEV